MSSYRKILPMVMAVLLCISALTGCSSTSSSDSYYGTDSVTSTSSWTSGTNSVAGGMSNAYKSSSDEYDSSYEYESAENNDSKVETDTSDKNIKSEKLVYTADIEIETTEFDDSVKRIDEMSSWYGCIIQNKQYYDSSDLMYGSDYWSNGYRTYSVVLRVPSESFTSFLDATGSIGHVTRSNSYVDNITQKYYSTQSYLESYENQLAVLQDMYKNARDISEMIQVESRITEVSAKILEYQNQMDIMDLDVNYSTINISLREVITYTDNPTAKDDGSFGRRIVKAAEGAWNGLVEFIEDSIIWVVESIFGLAIVAIIVIVTVRKIKKIRKKKNGIEYSSRDSKKEAGSNDTKD